MRFLNIIVEMLGRFLPVGFGLVLLLAVYSYVGREDYSDDQITFTVTCSSVFRNAEQYPFWIIDECRKLRSEH